MVACGPFCLGADYSDWSPLEAFLDKIASLRPDVVFLLGPFLDARQSSAVTTATASTAIDGYTLFTTLQ